MDDLQPNGKCHKCGTDISHKADNALWCNDSCRMRYNRAKQKQTAMNGTPIQQGNQVELYHHPTEEIDLKDAATTYVRQLKASKEQAERTAYKLDEENKALRDQKNEQLRTIDKLEAKIERITEKFESDKERLQEKFERELKDFESSNGLGSIVQQNLNPEVMQALVTEGLGLVKAVVSSRMQGQSGGTAYSALVTKLANLVNEGKEVQQQKIFNLISSIINEANLQGLGDDGLVILIDSIINSINNGTFRNNQEAHQG